MKKLLEWQDEPTLVEENKILGATFHPELASSLEIHRYFLEKCKDEHHG